MKHRCDWWILRDLNPKLLLYERSVLPIELKIRNPAFC